jgi:hypothetical protein
MERRRDSTESQGNFSLCPDMKKEQHNEKILSYTHADLQVPNSTVFYREILNKMIDDLPDGLRR